MTLMYRIGVQRHTSVNKLAASELCLALQHTFCSWLYVHKTKKCFVFHVLGSSVKTIPDNENEGSKDENLLYDPTVDEENEKWMKTKQSQYKGEKYQ